MDFSEISAVIPTYNALHYLQRTVKSLEAQKPDPFMFEVIIVDDGSTDGTSDWLSNYKGKLRITTEKLDRNQGRSYARNRGAELANGKLLLFIDGDMEFGAGFVNDHASHHDGTAKVVIGRILYNKIKTNRGYARYLETRGAMKLNSDQQVPGRYFLSGNASMPSSFFQDMGGFDTGIRVYGEDIDFGMRIESNGGAIYFAPELAVEHLHLRSINDALALAYQYGSGSVPYLVDKHPQLYDQLRLSWLDKKGVRGVFRRLLLSKTVFSSVKTVVQLMSQVSLPSKLYDYLLYRSYSAGYRDQLKVT